jgi:glycosyltransferase involved in cell wall biosynthesis
MASEQQQTRQRRLVWVYGEPIAQKLDVATWVETSSELHQAGWRVTLVVAGPRDQYNIHGVEVVSFPKPQVYLLRQAIFHLMVAGWLARRWSTIDVVLFHHMAAPWLLPMRVVRLLQRARRPLLVMDTRDLTLPESGMKNRLRVLFEQTMHRLAGVLADGQTAITQRMADLVHVPARKLWGMWPSGVNLERFAAARETRRWPQGDEPVGLVYVGVMLRQRHLLELCRAVERANAEGMAFTFTLVGNGPARQELEAFAAQSAGRIRLPGQVPHAQVPDCLAQAHVGVTAMFPPEQLISQAASPIKLFEYIAAGMPVLATRTACHTDVAGESSYVFWAEDASVESLLEALRHIWQARAMLEKRGHEAAREAHAWTWHEAAKKLRLSLEHGLATHT